MAYRCGTYRFAYKGVIIRTKQNTLIPRGRKLRKVLIAYIDIFPVLAITI
jgi:hypothetical protein